jgi:hypothetical protein
MPMIIEKKGSQAAAGFCLGWNDARPECQAALKTGICEGCFSWLEGRKERIEQDSVENFALKPLRIDDRKVIDTSRPGKGRSFQAA